MDIACARSSRKHHHLCGIFSTPVHIMAADGVRDYRVLAPISRAGPAGQSRNKTSCPVRWHPAATKDRRSGSNVAGAVHTVLAVFAVVNQELLKYILPTRRCAPFGPDCGEAPGRSFRNQGRPPVPPVLLGAHQARLTQHKIVGGLRDIEIGKINRLHSRRLSPQSFATDNHNRFLLNCQ